MGGGGMILESLVELARREGLLANPDYVPLPVAWILAVGDEGRFISAISTAGEAAPGKKPRAKVLPIPRRIGRTSGAAADFLVDKSEYVLGVEPDGKRSREDLAERLGLFRTSVQEALAATKIPALAAVSGFLESDAERGQAIEHIAAQGYQSNDLFAFQLHGQLVHELPEIQKYFSVLRRSVAGTARQCLICGATAVPVKKHPSVKVPGGTTSGVALVSFNSDAFESYGFSGNENACVCRDCADAYTTALNRLLSDRYPDPRNPGQTLPSRFVRLSPDTTALFWADEEAGVLQLLKEFFDAPRVESVRDLLEAPSRGTMPPGVANRFYCLILSGGQGRAVLRGMHTGTVNQLERSVGAYFNSMDIDSERPLPLRRLLEALVLQGKLDNLPPELATEVFLAILFERKFPQTLLARAVGRCRAEQKVPRERAAILRAYLIRNLRQEVSVGLDKTNTSVGYRLGRLMAVLERAQAAAQGNPNKTIVDRYYSAASTRPGTVFPRLVALAQHHIAKLTGGLAAFYHSRVGDVMDGIAGFPATLSMVEQGLFALGYYHQRQDFYKKADADAGNGENGSEKGEAA
jgi:CRISPR-associated protein Csd1